MFSSGAAAAGSLLILSGPSGVGKSTIIRELLELDFYCVRSYTTREMRPGESAGNPYYFISKDEFLKRQSRNEFLIWQEMNGNYYGARTEDFVNAMRQGKNVVFDMDARVRLDVVKSNFPNFISCFILPESIDQLGRRMKVRDASVSKPELEQRLSYSREMLKSPPDLEYWLLNKEGYLGKTVASIKSIVAAHVAGKLELNFEHKSALFRNKHRELCDSLNLPKISYSIVLTGAPCSGKTTTLNALREHFKNNDECHFIDEVPTQYIKEAQGKGLNPFANLVEFEQVVKSRQIEAEDTSKPYVFSDRGMYDCLAISKMLKIGEKEGIDIIGELTSAAAERKYSLVFILDRLKFEATDFRREHDEKDVILQDKYLRETYTEHSAKEGFKLVELPVADVQKRIEMILDELMKHGINLSALDSKSADSMSLDFNSASDESLAVGFGP